SYLYSWSLAGAGGALRCRMDPAIHRSLLRGQTTGVLQRLSFSLRRIALVGCEDEGQSVTAFGSCLLIPEVSCYALGESSPLQGFEKAPPEVQEILTKPIRELGLKLEGSPLERFVQKLYRELEARGIRKFRPPCYLSD